MECNKTRNGWQTSGSSLQQNILKETSDHRYHALICSNVFQNVCISPFSLSLPLSLSLPTYPTISLFEALQMKISISRTSRQLQSGECVTCLWPKDHKKGICSGTPPFPQQSFYFLNGCGGSSSLSSVEGLCVVICSCAHSFTHPPVRNRAKYYIEK